MTRRRKARCSTRRRRAGDTPTARRAGFTLLELLVVVGIIAILAGITFTIGPRVLGDQKKRATQNMLATLDRVLDEYLQSSGGQHPPFSTDTGFLRNTFANIPGPDVAVGGGGSQGDQLNSFAAYGSGDNGVTVSRYSASGGVGESYPRMPTAASFLRQIRGAGQTDAILNGIPSRFLVQSVRVPESGQIDPSDVSANVVDGWGAKADWGDPFPLFDGVPVLFVHPRNALAQELYGRCVNGRGYFMSAGGDRRYGVTNQFTSDPLNPAQRNPQFAADAVKALDDNLYSYPVTLPADRNPNSNFNQAQR